MDEILKLLRPEVLAAMVLCPIALQFIRSRFQAFAATHAAVVNFAVVAGVVTWALRAEIAPPTAAGLATLATQVIIAWFLSDRWYAGAIQPIANSSNPVIPAANSGGAK